MKRILFTCLLLFIFSISIGPPPLFAKEVKITNPDLISAIEAFNSKEFGTALSSLMKAKEGGANIAVTAYYLGLTHKELLVFDRAISFLNIAAEETPGVKDAFYSLAEIYFHLGKPVKALSEIDNAEKADVKPAYTAYLKGLILMSQKNFDKAIEAFESAKRNDPGLTDAADYQINIASGQIKKSSK